jgi:hypothetical protein
MMAARKFVMKSIVCTFLFCLFELAISGFLYGIFFSVESRSFNDFSIVDILGVMVFTSAIRFFAWQVLLQAIIVYLSIRYYNGWPKLWPVLLAVLASMLLWSLISSGIHLTFKPEPFRIAFMFGGIPILIGSILSWLILYKWLGLGSQSGTGTSQNIN